MSNYEYKIGNEHLQIRYVCWKGQDKLFADIRDKKGNIKTVQIKLELVR